MKKNDLISKWGYKDSSPFKNSKFLDINSSSITTKGVSIPLLLQPDGDPPVVAPPNSGEYYFPNSTKVRETPMKHGGFVSKWLGVYQDGGPLPLDLSKLSKEEYAKLYKEGRVATYDKQSDAYQPPVLPEATVSAKAPRSFGDFFDRYGKKKTAETSSLAQAMFAAPAEYLMGLPQAATTYLLDSEKNLEPSKALGVENKWAALATDAVLDPTNITGAGLLAKGKAAAVTAKSMEKGLLSKAHKLNPWAFKPDAESYYRVVGKDAVEDALESGVIRSKASQDVVQDGINLGARPTAFPSFSKGKISTEYADGLPDHGLIETTRPMKASTLGRHGKGTTQFPVDESGQYVKEFPLGDAKIYEKDWLRGYKEIPKPKGSSVANKADDLVDLWRIQEKGSRKTAELASEGKLGPLFNNPDAIKHFEGREKHFGEWFTKDKNDLDFYKSDREFTDPEIINLKVPQSKLKEFQNYDKSLSRAPDREFVIPQDQQSVYRAAAPIVARASQSEYQRGGQVNNFISKWLT